MAEAMTWKCPNCGGGLIFDPETQKFHCQYCLSDFDREELETPEPDDSSGEPEMDGRTEDPMADGGAEEPEAAVYLCPSCGAELVTDGTTAAAFCFYCHNPVILQGRLEGAYRPDYVIPFTVRKEWARQIFLDWLRKKRFVPKSFYDEKQLETMTGVYFPYWLYSCRADGTLEAEGTKLRIWTTGNLRYTETSRYQVSRKGQMQVEHVPRNALKKADRRLAEGVMPYRTEKMQPFSMEYLSGFYAEKWDMGREQFEPEVEAEVRAFAADQLKESVSGYHSLKTTKESVQLSDPQWSYALLTVWTLTYKDKKTGTIYYFACNGQTGKVCGRLPLDRKKLGLFFLEIFLPVAAFLLLAGYLI